MEYRINVFEWFEGDFPEDRSELNLIDTFVYQDDGELDEEIRSYGESDVTVDLDAISEFPGKGYPGNSISDILNIAFQYEYVTGLRTLVEITDMGGNLLTYVY